jgi:hypothetical protein
MLEIGIQNLKPWTYILQQKYLAILFNKKHASTHLWRMEWTNKNCPFLPPVIMKKKSLE